MLLKKHDFGEYTVEFSDIGDPGYLSVKVVGLYRPGHGKGFADIVFESMKQLKYSSCLLDFLEVDIQMSLVEIASRPKNFAQSNIPRSFSFALLVKAITDEMKFGDDFLKNNGWDFGLFTEKSEAEAWIFTRLS